MTPYHQTENAAIYHGDCAGILAGLDIRPQLILTSPPYDSLRNYGGHGFDFDRVADALVGVMPPGGVLVWIVADTTVDGSETGMSFRQSLGCMARGLNLHDTMIYERDAPGSWASDRYDQTHEYMFVLSLGRPGVSHILKDRRNATQGTVKIARGKGRPAHGRLRRDDRQYVVGDYGRRWNIWKYGVGHNKTAPDFAAAHEHPATFPYALAADHIRTWTNPGDLVLDPMAGSGTTVRAAVDLGRSAVGIDVHEPYCELATRRLSQLPMPLETTTE